MSSSAEEKILLLLAQLVQDVSGLKVDVSGLKENGTSLKEDVSGLKEDVSGLKEDVSSLKEDVSGLKEDVSGLKEDVSSLKKDNIIIKDRLNVLEYKVDHLMNTTAKMEFDFNNKIDTLFSAFDLNRDMNNSNGKFISDLQQEVDNHRF